MTLNDFEAIIAGLKKTYKVDYDAESEHAFVETPGGTVSLAFVRNKKSTHVGMAPWVRMSLRNLIQFLTHLNETIDSLGLEEAVAVKMPGSFYYDDEDEFRFADSVKVSVSGHIRKAKQVKEPFRSN